jgi:hypothetical protein
VERARSRAGIPAVDHRLSRRTRKTRFPGLIDHGFRDFYYFTGSCYIAPSLGSTARVACGKWRLVVLFVGLPVAILIEIARSPVARLWFGALFAASLLVAFLLRLTGKSG